MSANFIVRPFMPSDASAVISLWNHELPSTQPWNEPGNVIRRKLDTADGLFFVGERNERIIATVMAGYDGIRGWIYSLAVAHDCRRRGYGRQMMRRAEQELRMRGCHKINLQVRATNTEMIAFYERLGYVVEDRTSMGKPLPPEDKESKWRDQPTTDSIQYRDSKEIPKDAVLALYQANGWSSANKPEQLHQALQNSHSLVTAWDGDRLVGLANAISDGHLVVYYPHVAVLPDYQGKGIGRRMMTQLMQRYEGFHQHTVVADKDAVTFFKRCGFERAGQTEPMWIFDGTEH